MIANDIKASPDLIFDVNLLVSNKDQVACRIHFNCTPKGKLLGLDTAGEKISFAEHVFYNFRNGKIYEVRSLLDKAGIQAQI